MTRPRPRTRVAIGALAAAAMIVGAASVAAVGSGGPSDGLRLGPRADMKPIAHGKLPASGSTVLTLHSSSLAGAVSVTPKVYVVLWGSQWGAAGAPSATGDPKGAATALQSFFANLYGAPEVWGNTLSQYCAGATVGGSTCPASGVQHVVHPTASVLAGVWFDNAAPAPATATQAQLATEALKAATHFGASASVDTNAQYVIASPSGTNPNKYKSSGFCAWHSSTSSSTYASVGTVAYTNLPYLPDLGAAACTTEPNPQPLDGYFSTETHEYAETVTDFWPSHGWLSSGGNEIGDLCVALDGYETLGGVTYDVQGLWSNAAKACVTNGT